MITDIFWFLWFWSRGQASFHEISVIGVWSCRVRACWLRKRKGHEDLDAGFGDSNTWKLFTPLYT